MRSDVDCARHGVDVAGHAAPPPTTAAGTTSVGGAPQPIRRGRGTFQHRLRTADLEEYQQRSNNRDVKPVASTVAAVTLPLPVPQRAGTNRAQGGGQHLHPTSSAATCLTTTESVEMTTAGQSSTTDSSLISTAAVDKVGEHVRDGIVTTGVEDATTAANTARLTGMANMALKKDIPLEQMKTLPVWREEFGVFDENVVESDTVRQLLFRGEKRRRYCMIIGDLQNTSRVVNLRLFGHRGLKPFQLQNKLIRLVNLSIGRVRVRKPEIYNILDHENGNDANDACGAHNGDGEARGMQEQLHNNDNSDNKADESSTAPESHGSNVVDNRTCSPSLLSERTAVMAKDGTRTESIDANNNNDDKNDADNNYTKSNNNVSNDAIDRAKSEHDCYSSEHTAGIVETKSAPVHCDPSTTDSLRNILSHALAEADRHYQERANDEVMPLTVQHSDGVTVTAHETSLANSPVLTARYFTSLTDYFMREFRFLLGMSDVQAQNVSVDFNLGTAYYCLPRHNSYDSPLKHVTFCEFVERMNQDSMQMNFIRDCPPCVSRAVDMECGALHHEASLTSVRMVFFSNERQSRSIARAMWDCEQNRFKLLDMENMGVSFNWTIFSLDETFARRKSKQGDHGKANNSRTMCDDSYSAIPTAAHSANTSISNPSAAHVSPGEESARHTGGDDAACAAAAARAAQPGVSRPHAGVEEDDITRNKTVAYPFEVEFRAFRRWRQHGEHPAAALAEAILDKLSVAEYNLIQHGSSIGYERMDLSHVCEVDYASDDFNVELIIVDHTARGRPQGTDILVDNTTSLYIENFAAARQLKEKIAQYGPAHVAAMQNAKNNNYIRNKTNWRSGGRSAMPPPSLSLDLQTAALQPPSRLTFFRARGSTVHWRFRPTRSVEENIAPLTEALSFVQQVLHTANNIERTSARGGAGPEAI